MKVKKKVDVFPIKDARPYPNEHACRLNSPDKYERFARKNCEQKHDGKCIDVIYGIKAGKSEIQALRYPKRSWNADAARSHCQSRGGSFEAASGGKNISTGILERRLMFDLRAADKEQRTIPISFSSEEPVERFFGIEILDHNPESIRDQRLKLGIPLLVNHSRDEHVGIVEGSIIGPDRKGRGIARFGRSDQAQEIFQDVLDGIRKDASVGYQIHKMILEKEDEAEKTYRATDWEPLEVSLVAIPADVTVGVGRGEGAEFEIEIEDNQDNSEEIREMEEDKIKTEDKLDLEKIKKEVETRSAEKERTRVSEILALGKRSNLMDKAQEWIKDGKSIESFRQLIMDSALEKLESKIEVGNDRAEKEPFKNFGEYLFSVGFVRGDPRLRPLAATRILGERAMSMGVGSAGGFAIPEQFGPMLREVPPEESLFRSKSFVVPAGEPPDAKITFPAIDIGTSHGRLGGFDGNWIGEGVTKPETALYLREIELEPKEYAARLIVTDKLLRNWAAASAVIERMAKAVIVSAEELAYISGNGVNKPLGVANAANTAAIAVTRNGAAAIAWVDIYTMYRRILRQGGGSPFWVCSSTCLSQLINMKDDGSVLVWQPNAREGMPAQMIGLPFYIYDRLPALGSRGDLMLLNLDPYYYIKDGSGPFFAASEHVYFESNKTVFKIFWNVDGQPALKEAIPLEGSTTSTVSPFVILV